MKARYWPCFAVNDGAIHGPSFRRRIYAYFEGVLAKTVEDSNLENADLTSDNGANGLFGGGVEAPAQLFHIGAGACVVCDPDAYTAFMGEDPFPAVFVLHLNRLSAE